MTATIDWVHGYRGFKSRNNVRYLADGSVAYHAAGLGIVYDAETKTQRHFDKHTDDVSAMAFSPDLRTVATGEVGKKPKIFVWDAMSMQVKHQLSGKLTNGIKCLSFSPSGKFLAAVDSSNDHQVAVYNALNGVCVACVGGDKIQIVDLCWRDDTAFTTAGVRHLKFWALAKGLRAKNGTWGSVTDKNVACVAFNGDRCLTGSSKGGLAVWREMAIEVVKDKLHTGVIDTIRVTKEHIFTGGRDCRIQVLDSKTYATSFSFSFDDAELKSVCAKPRSIDLDPTGKFVVVGTFGCEIFTKAINFQTGKATKPAVITQGHYAPKTQDSNEVWGLCTVPGRD